MNVVWMPTLRCNLACSYCAARQLPQAHAQPELTPEAWIALFQGSPRSIEQVAITGGEPALYPSMKQVVDACDWNVCIDTNLRVDPRTWLPDDLNRMVAINAGLHFDAAHTEARCYWDRLSWLREHLPVTSQIVCCYVVLWRDQPERVQEVEAQALARGVEFRPLTFDHSFLWKRPAPLQAGFRTCNGGSDFLVMMPDATAYRCIGHAYYDLQPLGQGADWPALDAWTPCHEVICTTCDQTMKSDLEPEPPCQP